MPAMAADIYIERKYEIHIDGQIKPGDAEKIASLLGKMTAVSSFFVNSNGGNVGESMKIASLIEGVHATFRVKKGGVCASACFLMLVAAQHRFFSYFLGEEGQNPTPEMIAKRSFVGIHRPYLGSKNEVKKSSAEKQEEVMHEVRNYLRKKQVPQYLVDEMMGRASNQVYWLRAKDGDLLGEYSPGYEEILIKECGYNKMEIDNTWSEDRVARFIKCDRDVWNREYLQPQILYLIKLEIGWRPWLANLQ